MKFRNATQTALALLLTACSSKEGAEDKSPEELLADSCASFCERALSCPLGLYAELWSFQDEQTCTSQCLKFHADVPSDPPEVCLEIRAELWSCAGEIEDCSTYEAFEADSFAMTPWVPNPCNTELDTFLHKCNG